MSWVAAPAAALQPFDFAQGRLCGSKVASFGATVYGRAKALPFHPQWLKLFNLDLIFPTLRKVREGWGTQGLVLLDANRRFIGFARNDNRKS